MTAIPIGEVWRHGFGAPFRNMKVFGEHRHVERKGAAGGGLAIRAIAGIEQSGNDAIS
jgi:hypothetical protein